MSQRNPENRAANSQRSHLTHYETKLHSNLSVCGRANQWAKFTIIARRVTCERCQRKNEWKLAYIAECEKLGVPHGLSSAQLRSVSSSS